MTLLIKRNCLFQYLHFTKAMYTADRVRNYDKQQYAFYVGIKGIYYFTDRVRAVSCRHHNFIVILSIMMNKEAMYIIILCFFELVLTRTSSNLYQLPSYQHHQQLHVLQLHVLLDRIFISSSLFLELLNSFFIGTVHSTHGSTFYSYIRDFTLTVSDFAFNSKLTAQCLSIKLLPSSSFWRAVPTEKQPSALT